MAAKKSDPAQYTRPELRDSIKAEVTAGDKGGQPGQWSARKAQLVAQEYDKQGGGYKHPRTDEQESLKEWGEEHWTTSDGKPAKRDSGTTRYLPAAAWDELSDEEKDATNRKKQAGSAEGKQFVANTAKAAEARGAASAKTAGTKQAGRKAVARKKAPTRSGARAAAKAEAKRSSDTAKQDAARKKAAPKKPAVKSTAEADRKAAQKKKAIAASRKAAAQTRKRVAERASRKP